MAEESLSKYLEMAVLTEENGHEFYADMAGRFAGEEEVSRIFRLLSEDEQRHASLFRHIIERHGEGTGETDDETMQYLRASSTSRFFDEDFKSRIEEVDGPEDALREAFMFEKATLVFYDAIRQAHGTNEALEEIIDAEKEHLSRLMKVILNDARFRGLADTW
jgi:rubrerythrin